MYVTAVRADVDAAPRRAATLPMNLTHVRTLAVAALRSVQYLLRGDVGFPRQRLGTVLETPAGETFVVYRETERRSPVADGSGAGVVLVFRMRVTRAAGDAVREVLADPLANVATPFFAGMPGFRRKLWLAGDRSGSFLELYEWADETDARRFVDVLQSLLEPFDFAGEASFEVVDADSVDDYLATHAASWRVGARAGFGRRRRRGVGVAVLLLLLGYLVWRSLSRDDDATGREQA